VKRLVLRGTPPDSGDLGDLARAYAEYLVWTVGRVRPERQFRLQVTLGASQAILGLVDLIAGLGRVPGPVFLMLGLIQLAWAPMQRRDARRLVDGLERSRAALGVGRPGNRPKSAPEVWA
jgi:hypothetical protein